MLWISSSSHTHHCSVRPAPPTRERHSDDSSLHAEWRWRPSQVTASPAERLKPRFQCLLICNQPHSQKVGKGRAASKLPRADQVSYPSIHQKGQPCCPLHWRAGGETQPPKSQHFLLLIEQLIWWWRWRHRRPMTGPHPSVKMHTQGAFIIKVGLALGTSASPAVGSCGLFWLAGARVITS